MGVGGARFGGCHLLSDGCGMVCAGTKARGYVSLHAMGSATARTRDIRNAADRTSR